jgi:hypothetical protein
VSTSDAAAGVPPHTGLSALDAVVPSLEASDAAAGAPHEDDADPVNEATEAGGSDQISKIEEEVYLVEKLLESRQASMKKKDETHRTQGVKKCVRSHHKEYLVKFVDYATPEWVCQCDIGEEALEDGVEESAAAMPAASNSQTAAAERAQDTSTWKGKHSAQTDGDPPSARTRHAGKRAADLSNAAAGDFQSSGNDHNIECKTLKENQYAGERKNTTAGVFAVVSSCGLFLAVDELHGSESLTQVHLILFALFMIHKITPLDVIAYDDACHMVSWIGSNSTLHLL